MERQESNENVGLDVKPLRTLSPMFPSTYGFNTFSESGTSESGPSPFIYFSHSNPSIPAAFTSQFPFASNPQHASLTPQQPVAPVMNRAQPHSYSNGSFHNTTVSPTFSTPPINQTSALGRKIKQPTHFSSYEVGSSITDGSDGSKVKLQKKKPKKVQNIDMALIPSLPDPKDSVGVVLMTYDALRRRISQLDDGKDQKMSQRPDLKAGTTLMNSNLRANMGKRIGSVPGVEVGDIFYFRMELCLVGLHAPIMAGIDYMTATFSDGDDTVAASIVSSGGYENEESDVDTLIYSGQGGNANIDQKLERGNLALERSFHRGNTIRVIRSAKDYTVLNGKIYFYDGLYKVQSSWVEKGNSGYNVFKYKLMRQPEQPHGLAVWKMTQQWIDNPSSRAGIIMHDISAGMENLPVCVVNEVDDEKGPRQFKYSTIVEYLRPLSSMKPLELCRCLTVCLPGDANCTCAILNGGNLPYSSNGTLVSRKPLIYECNARCCCSSNCRNRVTQKGVRFQFEVFKTTDRGWGLRSWDPIRAGSFICEYTGEVVNKINLEDDNAEDDEYIFQTIETAGDKAFKWNYGPELLGEPSVHYSSESLDQLPIVIRAKNKGNISRFMNHSCSPNVFWQPVLYDHGDEGYPHIMLFAMKHIPPLTELTYDYGLSGGVGSRRTKECKCGSPKCRGLFG